MKLSLRRVRAVIAVASIVLPTLAGSPASAFIHDSPVESSIESPRGVLRLERSVDTIEPRSRSNTLAVELEYRDRSSAIQGIEFTIESPQRGIRLAMAHPGAATSQPGVWTIDYQVSPTREGSRMKILMYARDSASSLVAGTHQLVMISFDAEPGAERMRSAELKVADLHSALASSFGLPADVVLDSARARTRLRFRGTGTSFDERFTSVAADAPLTMAESTGSRPFGEPVDDLRLSGVGGTTASITSILGLSPNPVRNELTIDYALERAAVVSIDIVDPLGRRVEGFEVEEKEEVGRRSVPVTVGGLAPGTYFIRMVTPWGIRSAPFVVVP